jgi:DAACS family dicarboxylate/amino acid:cation (Na+ or H+) symporter
MLMAILVSIGVPAEGVLLILGVDRFLDMCRTVLNVTGDLMIALLVSKSEHRKLKKIEAAHEHWPAEDIPLPSSN